MDLLSVHLVLEAAVEDALEENRFCSSMLIPVPFLNDFLSPSGPITGPEAGLGVRGQARHPGLVPWELMEGGS